MRRLGIILVLLAAAAAPAFTQTTSTQPASKVIDQKVSVEDSVLQVTREWLTAEESRDRATLQRIIADDFRGTGPWGQTVLKADVIPEEGSQSGGLAINASNLRARVFGDTAVVTANGVQKVGEKRELRFTVVFTKRDNRWQMVAGHLSAVPKE